MFEMPDITIISRCHNITGTYGNGYCLYVMHTCVAELEKRVCAFRHCTLSATSVGLYLFVVSNTLECTVAGIISLQVRTDLCLVGAAGACQRFGLADGTRAGPLKQAKKA